MSRRTEDDQALDLLANLKTRNIRVCELVPVDYPTYLEGNGAKEWRPIDDKRAARLLALLLLAVQSD